jgi:hypothetical protein
VQKRVMWRIVIASPLCVVGVVLLGLLYPLPAQATNHAIVTSATCATNGDGTAWSCATSNGGPGAFVGVPATLTRGDIYYLCDGNYGNHLSLSTAASGTTTIELRKAQSYDFGGLSGWSTATCGSRQAVWQWNTTKQGIVSFGGGGYFTLNGNASSTDPIGCGGVLLNPGGSQTAAAPNPSQCGIKIDNSTCTSTSLDYCAGGNGVMGGGTNIVWKYVEWEGSDVNANEPYFWLGSLGASGNSVTHSYLHAFGTTCWTYGFNNATFSYNYVWGTNDSSANHGECLQDTGSDANMVIEYNVFRDTITNGDLVFVDPSPGTHSNFKFIGNTIWCTSSGGCRHNDGIVACINSSQTCTGFIVAQNTVINCSVACGLNSTNAGSYTWVNNLYYNSSVSYTLNGSSFTCSNNSYVKSGTPGSCANDVNANSSPPLPFANWNSGSAALTTTAALASENADWNSRTTTSLDPLHDAAGNVFTTDRGAYQFGGATGPGTPTNLVATPH